MTVGCSVAPFRLSTSVWGQFIFFAYYATARLFLPVSSFLLTLMEFYGLHLQHLSLHSFILVATFVHFCEMFVGVRPSVPLF
jgi:hypothetical protein